MIQTIPRWKVAVEHEDGTTTVLWMFKPFITSVLASLAEMQFKENGISQPRGITITAAP